MRKKGFLTTIVIFALVLLISGAMSNYPMTSYFATGFQLTIQPKYNP